VQDFRSPPTAATELGGQVHKVFEAYYRGLTGAQAPQWASRAGQIASSALHLLPAPDACDLVVPEDAVGGPWCGEHRVVLAPDGDRVTFGPDGCRDDSKPTRAIVIDGVRYAGFVDLLVTLEAPVAVGIGADHAVEKGALLIDYKTSSDPRRYGKTPEALADNFAANLYAINAAMRLGIDRVPCRWPYISTGHRREAVPSDFTVDVSRAWDVVASRTALVRRLESYERPEDAPCNPEACADFGGRACHMSKGGPCNAKRSIRSLILSTCKGETKMALSPELQAKFEAMRNKKTPVEEAPVEEAPVEEAPVEEAPVEEIPPPPPTLPPTAVNVLAPAKARAPRAAKVAPTTPAPLESAGDRATRIAGLARNLADAQAKVDEILARTAGLAEATAARDAALVELSAACAG
jgi:hypothetical protein